MRQIVLDTETTGLDPQEGHRIIEIGCIELIKRRITKTFHIYINPEREIDEGALQVHGITQAFLKDKPKFIEIAEEFLSFIGDDELIIHNAPFDLSFLNHELLRIHKTHKKLETCQRIIDTLVLARKLYPGQKNSLDALCKRLNVDSSHRELHGALLDAELLAKVYLAMTGGQSSLFGDELNEFSSNLTLTENLHTLHSSAHLTQRLPLPILSATSDELTEHQAYLEFLQKKAGKHYWSE